MKAAGTFNGLPRRLRHNMLKQLVQKLTHTIVLEAARWERPSNLPRVIGR